MGTGAWHYVTTAWEGVGSVQHSPCPIPLTGALGQRALRQGSDHSISFAVSIDQGRRCTGNRVRLCLQLLPC